MVSQEEDNSIALLVSKMKQKRDDLLIELEKVQKWLTQVESFVNQGKAIVGEQKPIIGELSGTLPEITAQIHGEVEPPETKAGRILRLIGDKPATGKTHADKIKQLFEEIGGPMSISQIDDQFIDRKWPIQSKDRRQIIYNTMVRRKDWFVKLGEKMWGLRGRDDINANLDTA